MSVPVAAMTAQPPGIVSGIDPKMAASNHKLDPINSYMYNNNTNPPSTTSVDGSYQFYYQQQQQQQHRYYSTPPNAGQYPQMMPQGQFNQFNATGPPVAQPGMNGQMSHYPNYYYQQPQGPPSNYYNNVNPAAYTPQPPQQHPPGVSMMQAPMVHGSNVGMMQGGAGQQQLPPITMMGQPQQMANAGYYAPNSMGVNNMKQPNGPTFPPSQTGSNNSTPTPTINNSSGTVTTNGQSPTTSPAKKGRKPSGLTKAEVIDH